VFGEDQPPISSTKSLTGHSLGATGVQEAIYCILMMQGDFIAASANVTELDPALRPGEIATERVDGAGSTRCSPTASASAAPTPRWRSAGSRVSRMGIMAGKRGLVMGVANDHSIAWGIAKTLHDQGAELALTYQGEGFGKRVRPLAESIGAPLVAAGRRDGRRLARRGVRGHQGGMGQHGLPRPRHRLFRQGRASGPLRRHVARELPRTMEISCYSFVDVTRRAAELMPRAARRSR
jgi:hypothetical protein